MTTPNYITGLELREYLGSDTTNWADLIDAACTVASRTVEGMTDRIFFDEGVVSTRYYEPEDYYCVEPDDFSTATGLVVQTVSNYVSGTYDLTWDATSYRLEPVNRNHGPYSGWPYEKIVARGISRFFPLPVPGLPETVAVTAQWGWEAVPEQIKHATLIAAKRLFQLKDADPTGTMGLDGWGPVKIRENPEVRALLEPFARSGLVTII